MFKPNSKNYIARVECLLILYFLLQKALSICVTSYSTVKPLVHGCTMKSLRTMKGENGEGLPTDLNGVESLRLLGCGMR